MINELFRHKLECWTQSWKCTIKKLDIKYFRKRFYEVTRCYSVTSSNIDLKLQAIPIWGHICRGDHDSTKCPCCDSRGKSESSIASVWAFMFYGRGGSLLSRLRDGTDKPNVRSTNESKHFGLEAGTSDQTRRVRESERARARTREMFTHIYVRIHACVQSGERGRFVRVW